MEERSSSLVGEERTTGKSERTDSESEVNDISEGDVEPTEKVGDKKEDKFDDQEREE